MIRIALLFALFLSIGSLALASEQAMDLDTPTGVIKGTLKLPDGASKTPIVLIIAGSGPTDRDGNTPLAAGKNDSLKLLANALSSIGVASLRYDKRGIAASRAAGPSESDLRFEHYVDDAAAWMIKLTKDERFSGVAVMGHSEGSLIGMLAVQRSPAAAFISLAGPAEAASAVLRRQLKGRLPPDLAERNEEILRALEAGRTVADVPPALQALYRPSVQAYLASWFQFSPAMELAKLRMPCMVVQGGTDIQVRVADAQALQTANPNCTTQIIAGMNHVLKTVPSDQQAQRASYGDASLPLDAELQKALAGFFTATQTQAANSGKR
jgi:uncharacterized protein